MRTPVVLVGRRSDKFSALLSEQGYRVLNLELIKTEPFDDQNLLDDVLEDINRYDGLFITSPAAAEVLVRRLKAGGQTFAGKVYVVGLRANDVLKDAGLNVLHCESANTAEELIGTFGTDEFAGRSFLFIRGDKSLRVIPETLQSISRVDEVVVYRTNEITPHEDELNAINAQLQGGEIDWICVFSPSGVISLLKLIDHESVCRVPLAVIGETTAQAARDARLQVAFVAPKSSAEEFAKSFAEYLKTID